MKRLPVLWLLAATVLALTAPVQSQDDPALSLLPPPGRDLLAIPFPRLDEVEAAVADQVRQLQQTAGRVVASSRASRELAEAYGSLGRLYHAYEFFEAAEAAYVNALRMAPRDVRSLHLLAYLYQQTGRPKEAVDKYLAALRVDPTDRPVHVHLGEVYLELNRPRDAREQFEQIATTFPGVASNGLGEVAVRDGRYDDAIRHFRSALDRLPDATSIHYSLAMAYRGLGRLDDARAHLLRRGNGGVRAVDPIVDELQTLVRGERALVIRGTRAYEAGQFNEAANAFRQALAANPSSAAARVNLGLALSRLGNTADAVEQFEAALGLEADNLTAHASLGMILARQGRDSLAVDHLQRVFAQTPNDVTVRKELVGTLLRLRREDDAIAVLARARTIDPDEEDALVSLSILLADRARYREAVELLEDANRRFPDRLATATTLARLLASSPDRTLREGRRALELAEAIHASEPTPVHRETVALALAELGRCGEASRWMRRAVEEAEREGDRAEAARLKGELPKYEAASCRPPGR